jgi:hypothetical protein
MSDEKQPEIKTKRFSLSKEERERVGNIQSVMGILSLLRKGMDHSLTLALMEARVRMGIKDSDAPKGFVRSVDFDPNSDELIVRDVPMPPEPAKKPDEPKAN